MNKNIWLRFGCLVVLLSLIIAVSCSTAFAADRDDRVQEHKRQVVVVKSERDHGRDDKFSRGGLFGFALSFFTPPSVFFKSVPYYHSNVIIQEPVAIQPLPYYAEAITIDVPNVYGGYTPVTLVKHGNCYVGPQGEYYPGNPTIAQLRVLYGNRA